MATQSDEGYHYNRLDIPDSIDALEYPPQQKAKLLDVLERRRPHLAELEPDENLEWLPRSELEAMDNGSLVELINDLWAQVRELNTAEGGLLASLVHLDRDLPARFLFPHKIPKNVSRSLNRQSLVDARQAIDEKELALARGSRKFMFLMHCETVLINIVQGRRRRGQAGVLCIVETDGLAGSRYFKLLDIIPNVSEE
jgi:hypothetical protein